MDELLKYICNGIIAHFSAQIAEADANPDKWYELYVAEENEGTHSVASGDTFAECFAQIDEYIAEYRFDRLNIDIWTNPDNPQNEAGLLLCSLIYRLIKEYFTNHERNNDKSFGYGSFEFDENDQQVNFRHEYNGTGSIFKDRIAFTFFHNMTCYISELDTDEIPLYEEEDFHPGSTYPSEQQREFTNTPSCYSTKPFGNPSIPCTTNGKVTMCWKTKKTPKTPKTATIRSSAKAKP